jgi:hypothetical protein
MTDTDVTSWQTPGVIAHEPDMFINADRSIAHDGDAPAVISAVLESL